jgi:hypothetical protein
MRTRQARRHPQGRFTRQYERLPGSPHPFRRIQALLAAAKTAAWARMSAMEKMRTVLNRGFWHNLLTAVVPALERRAAKMLVEGKKQFDEKDAELVRTGRALLSYKSRGHGRAQYTDRLSVPSRSKYQLHQGERERARRRAQYASMLERMCSA